MRLIFLNTWTGKEKKEITKFLQSQLVHTDVFCLQEVRGKMKLICDELLTNYHGYFIEKFPPTSDIHHQATFVNSNFPTKSEVLLLDNPSVGVGLHTQVQTDYKTLNICNVHGCSLPGNKLDTPERLLQSKSIIEFYKKLSGLKIIGGDFNLDIKSRSVEMFEEAGYLNLIKEFNIPTTRNRLSWEIYPDHKQYFSDYVFVNSEIKVKSFSVPQIEVSDHLPLILDVDIP